LKKITNNYHKTKITEVKKTGTFTDIAPPDEP